MGRSTLSLTQGVERVIGNGEGGDGSLRRGVRFDSGATDSSADDPLTGSSRQCSLARGISSACSETQLSDVHTAVTLNLSVIVIENTAAFRTDL